MRAVIVSGSPRRATFSPGNARERLTDDTTLDTELETFADALVGHVPAATLMIDARPSVLCSAQTAEELMMRLTHGWDLGSEIWDLEIERSEASQ